MADQLAAKRLKVDSDGSSRHTHELADLLSRLHSLLTSAPQGTQEDGVDGVLNELARLQTTLNTSSSVDEATFKAIADTQEQLQVAIVALQAAVDRFTPPPGYMPPVPGDQAFVRGLLSYAHRLSYSSSAPLGYQTGQPLYFFKPPAPQEAEMRASQLHAFSRDWEARQQAAAAQRQITATAVALGAAPPSAQPEAAPGPGSATAAPVPAPVGDVAAMAAQHGLDVAQLLASIPPGWKPGDPIPLGSAAGAGEAAPAAGKPQPAAQAPAAAPQMQREPSPGEEERAPAAAPPVLTGIFLDDFGQYDYDVSSGEDAGNSDEDSDDERD